MPSRRLLAGGGRRLKRCRATSEGLIGSYLHAGGRIGVLVDPNDGPALTQAIAVAVSWGYSCVMTFIILKAVDALIGLRVPEDEEVLGLDTTQHGEIAYQL